MVSCFRILKDLGVTAVLNAAQGNLEGWSLVNTKEGFYRPHGIRFLGVPGVDLNSFPLADYFHEAADFIDEILREGGRVFVHCVQVRSVNSRTTHLSPSAIYFQGISRSATLVLAFLIIKKKIRLEDAIKSIGVKRSIAPNEGFMLQLIELNDDVHKLL